MDKSDKWEWSLSIKFFPSCPPQSMASPLYLSPALQKRKSNMRAVQRTLAVFLYFMSLNSWRCLGTTSKILDLFPQNGNYIFCIHYNWLNQQWCPFHRNHLYPVLISFVCMVYKGAKQLQAEWTGLLWSGERSPLGKSYAFNSMT